MKKGIVYEIKLWPRKALKYCIETTQSIQKKGIKYNISRTFIGQLGLKYCVEATKLIQKSVEYFILNIGSIQKDISYKVNPIIKQSKGN